MSIEPIGVTVEVDANQTLLDATTAAAVDLQVDCGGRGTCGKCLVRLGAGELTPPTDVELRKLSAERLAQGWRLACQASPVSPRTSIEALETGGRRQIPTASNLDRGRLYPAVVKETLSLPPADFDDSRSDFERLRDRLSVKRAPLSVLQTLPEVLRSGGFSVIATRYGDELIDVEPATVSPVAFGAAVDVGTSKIITYLVDLGDGRLIDQEAVENPQMRFGEDVVTRITEALQSGRLGELARAAREGINQTLERLFDRHEIPARHLYDMTVVGNTAMHHLVLGLSPVGLAGAPFAPAVAEPLTLRAGDLSLAMNAEGRVHLLPPIAGFVGSDCLAVIAATRLETHDEPAMTIDIGTNTEIALVAGGHITVTSCASGPAFEGYQIASGMKATEGAIERVSFTPDGRPDVVGTIGGGEPAGICGSGVVDVLAGLGRDRRRRQDGAHGATRARTRRRSRPRVRSCAALAATSSSPSTTCARCSSPRRPSPPAGRCCSSARACRLTTSPMSTSPARSATTSNLDNALAIGLLPPVPKNRIEFVGNAAGVGAQMALTDVVERDRIAGLRRDVEFLELATDAGFQEVFTRELGFGNHDSRAAVGARQ